MAPTNGEETAVIVELKQWQQAEPLLHKDGIIRTPLGGSWRETSHPSYQAWTSEPDQNYNETVRTESIRLVPCAYLHNMDDGSAVNDPVYAPHTSRAPVFISRDAERLADFLLYVRYDERDLLYRIENGRIRPSRNLADAVLTMLQGNDAFVMIDDQKVAFETALELAHRAQQGKRRC